MSPFMGDAEFKEEWFGEDEDGNSLHEIGMRGAWDADQARRGARQRRRHRRSRCSPVPTPPPARWARRSARGSIPSPRWTPSTCSRAPRVQPLGGRDLPGEPRASRRPDRGPDPRRPRRRHRRDPARRTPTGCAAASSSRRSGATTSRYTSYRYDPVWAVAQELDLPVHCHSGPRRAPGLRRSAGLDERLRLRDDLLHRAADVVHAAHRRVRALPAAAHGDHRSRAASGRPTCSGDST